MSVAFGQTRKRAWTPPTEEEEAALDEQQRASAQKRPRKKHNNGDDVVKCLDAFLSYHNPGMRNLNRAFLSGEGTLEDKELARNAADLLASGQWMPFATARDNAYSASARCVTPAHFKKKCRDNVKKAVKAASAAVKAQDAARKKKAREMRTRCAEDLTAQEDAMAADDMEEYLSSVIEAGQEMDGDLDAFMAAAQEDAPAQSVKDIAKKLCAEHMRALVERISNRTVPPSWTETRNVKFTGLTKKLATAFYPDGDPCFRNIPTRQKATRHSFKTTCGKTSAAHGTYVHEQVDAFVKWLTGGATVHHSCEPFLNSLSGPLDGCVLRVLNALKARRFYPIGSEVVLLDHPTRTVTLIDMVVYDLSVEGRLGVRAVELKTGYGDAGSFRQHAPDDVMMRGPCGLKDTPYHRGALQLLFCMYWAEVNYGIRFSGGSILYISPNPTEHAEIYGMPQALFKSDKTPAAVYVFFLAKALNTVQARQQMLTTIPQDHVARKEQWRKTLAKKGRR